MRLRIDVFLAPLCVILPLAGATFSYHVSGDDPGPWPRMLSSVGFSTNLGGPTNLFILRNGAPAAAQQYIDRIEQGATVVLEGESELAEALGFHASKRKVVVRSVVDRHAPKLSIVWEKPLELPIFEIPKSATVFTTERWEGAPLAAAIHRGSGNVLWIAAPPGQQGYERYPYLLQALSDLNVNPPFRSRRLWAFFDAAYRSRIDVDYFAERWRRAGVSALHVAAWHYYESDPEGDAYLRKLIDACHRNAILVYAWIELPHVSERFWEQHPEWREKTALLQDAQLDWRKLINLQNRDAAQAVRTGVQDLVKRFDWDGVNLAELYFESLEGAANPARFTPMNDDVRREFREASGFDPIELFGKQPDPARLNKFLDYRAELARREQTEWIAVMESMRPSKPNLDLVLTHVDDRFDTRMRELIGADAARVLPMLDQHDFTFLIEDPATVWNLGPQRYPEIAKRYEPLTPRTDRLAIDINIVERYQDVYPTKQQTGTELFELVHLAAHSFAQVALYFENSILAPDLALLPAAAADVDKIEQLGPKLVIHSKHGVGVPWDGPAMVNGKLWPVRDGGMLWIPPGAQVIETAAKEPTAHIVDFNGDLRSASSHAGGLELAYQSNSRAIAILDAAPTKLEIDGATAPANAQRVGSRYVIQLPRGQHILLITTKSVPYSSSPAE
jgi:hypothetical protein